MARCAAAWCAAAGGGAVLRCGRTVFPSGLWAAFCLHGVWRDSLSLVVGNLVFCVGRGELLAVSFVCVPRGGGAVAQAAGVVPRLECRGAGAQSGGDVGAGRWARRVLYGGEAVRDGCRDGLELCDEAQGDPRVAAGRSARCGCCVRFVHGFFFWTA